jgi:branched-subunit amino acid transport protein AzlD
MPAGAMVILVAYTLRGLSPGAPWAALAVGLALAVTVGLHLWRHNAVLSILGGTAVHIALTALLH